MQSWAYQARSDKAQVQYTVLVVFTVRLLASMTIILLLVLSISCSARHVYIQPSEGEHCPGTPCYNITTFGKMAKYFSNSSGLVVHFLEGIHLLDLQEPVVLMNLTNAVFEGEGRMEQGFHETVWQSTVVIKCSENSSTGIAFVDGSNITFRCITVTNCGADMRVYNDYYCIGKFKALMNCNASLGYFCVNRITVDHASVQNGSENGLLIITDGGDLQISNSSFAQSDGNNTMVVYTSYYGQLPYQCKALNIINSNLSFGGIDCQYSASLSVLMLQSSYNVDIVLESVVVYKNTGNGIYIASNAINVPTYNLTIKNSHISHSNRAGLIITTRPVITPPYDSLREIINFNQAIVIVNSNFAYNHQSKAVIEIAFEGIQYTPSVIIESTEISHNTPYNHGLFLSSRTIYRTDSHFKVSLLNVIVNNNSICPMSSDTDEFTSAIHGVFVTSLVLNNVSIINNIMTGLSVYHTAVQVNGASVFHNNTGVVGGGLGVYGDSYLNFEYNSMLYFTNNSATRGGAIFVETSYLLSESVCFFQYSNSETKLQQMAFFSGNKADVAGSVLYGGDIHHCYLYSYYNLSIDQSQYFNRTFEYSTQSGSSVISSDPIDVCFCDDDKMKCSKKSLSKKAYPGEKINISIAIVGQENGIVPGFVNLYYHSQTNHFTNANNCTSIEFTAENNTNYLLYYDYYPSEKRLNITMEPCPVGFGTSNGTCECEKQLRYKIENIKCIAANNTITQPGDNWIGEINGCAVAFSPCPFDYCKTTQVNFNLTHPDAQCALNRSGTLCGKCKKDYSLALGSNNCIKCNDAKSIALLIPFAAAGFGLVALLMVLNLTVSIGTINGHIFYASIVKISESTGIFFPNGPIPVLSQFIAWLNLDLGIETCFYPGMTAYVKSWLQFAFPLYIWFIIATIIVLCRYSTWLSNKIGGNVVQVLATLILLSFIKLFRTFGPALTWVSLSCKNASTTVWYVDGNVQYSSPKHLGLMAAAVLFLLLAVFYTFALLFDAVIEKQLTKIQFFHKQWIKFKPLIDAYHGPYKDNCRFWTGLLLLARMSFTLVSLYLTTFATLIFITAITTVLLSLLVAFEGVYQKRYLNILECSSLLNLGLLSALGAVYQDDSSREQVVTVISVSVALVTFIGILLFHVLFHTKIGKYFRKYIVKQLHHKKNNESEKLLDVSSNQPISSPTSSDVFLKRESLIEFST